MDGASGIQSHEERGAEKLMDDYLRSLDLHRKKVAKDGSCLFRAVAEQVTWRVSLQRHGHNFEIHHSSRQWCALARAPQLADFWSLNSNSWDLWAELFSFASTNFMEIFLAANSGSTLALFFFLSFFNGVWQGIWCEKSQYPSAPFPNSWFQSILTFLFY